MSLEEAGTCSRYYIYIFTSCYGSFAEMPWEPRQPSFVRAYDLKNIEGLKPFIFSMGTWSPKVYSTLHLTLQ